MMKGREVLRRLAKALLPRTYESLVRARAARAASRTEAEQWRIRIEDALACPDNRRLPRHPGAGRVSGELQTMFNGIKVVANGYYGTGMAELLRRNKGSHEPQEELVFGDVLRRLPPEACMIECGAYWGFYSLWFAREIPQARVLLIEPDAQNADVGRRNFAVNGLHGEFLRAAIGRYSSEGGEPRVCVDDLMVREKIDHLQILHADIQGAEVNMLHGATRTLSAQKVDFIFISTHGEDLHRECVRMLKQFNYDVPVSVRPEESYSFDGLLVGHRRGILDSPLPSPFLKPGARGKAQNA